MGHYKFCSEVARVIYSGSLKRHTSPVSPHSVHTAHRFTRDKLSQHECCSLVFCKLQPLALHEDAVHQSLSGKESEKTWGLELTKELAQRTENTTTSNVSNGNHTRTWQRGADHAVVLEQPVQQTAAGEGPPTREAVPVVHRDGMLVDDGPLRGVARLDGYGHGCGHWHGHGAWTWLQPGCMRHKLLQLYCGVSCASSQGVRCCAMLHLLWLHLLWLYSLWRASSQGVRCCAILPGDKA